MAVVLMLTWSANLCVAILPGKYADDPHIGREETAPIGRPWLRHPDRRGRALQTVALATRRRGSMSRRGRRSHSFAAPLFIFLPAIFLSLFQVARQESVRQKKAEDVRQKNCRQKYGDGVEHHASGSASAAVRR